MTESARLASDGRDPDKTEPGLWPRVIAGAWFGAAACIPVGLFFLFVDLDRSNDIERGIIGLWSFIEFPVSLAAFFGFAVGSRILDLRPTQTAFRAMLRGIVVAVASYLAMPLINVMIGMFTDPIKGLPGRSFLQLIYWMFVIYAVGAILVGWLIVIVGGVAGYVLQRLSRKKMLRTWVATTRVSKRKAYVLNGAAAGFLVVANGFVLLFPSLLRLCFQILNRLAPAVVS